ncbi:protopine O-dealkylase-like [Tasmannia lanceolata]|uniref:protopine O-dealkylase-like n=1 Tax=Tasmannia lanceolata TaxID=3420 RepID=UPI0040628FFD
MGNLAFHLFYTAVSATCAFAMDSSQVEMIGGSLAVPSVQELVRESMATIPFRYIRLYLTNEISSKLQKLAMAILEMMARAMDMDTQEMKDIFEDGYQEIRLNYYPPCPQLERVVGLTPHSDVVGLTILLQVNEAQGQIRKNGMWVSVKPHPNAFIVNIGDIMEVISNGAYQSVEHRATVNSVQERLSCATFYSPNLKTEFGPTWSLTNLEKPPLFRRETVGKFFRDFFSKELQGRSHIETMKLTSGLD